MESVNVAIIYYSATGTIHALAQAAAEGAEKAGAQVRLRKVAGTEAKDSADVVEAATDDVAWADAVLFGTPTRFGNPAAKLKAFIDGLGVLWQPGQLADKVYSAFTSSATPHGGQESTILALGNVFYHWGGIIVPPGYTDPIQFQLGNPYGTSETASGNPPGDLVLDGARYQARRVTETAAVLKAGRAAIGGDTPDPAPAP
ncbi:NAD(P)H:quinone oxidoreductase [Actinoallomurus bryophytorum]|uniref:NAD(P)H dehydrogenase (Quinone) n=1 Tax=Actinoallomurus bryophytorum TaxID=1490222 RepID=A0A543CIY5_9ACTN|nr:NAD(P)H:quinone oxidoreductase [Actinoallomurus bryophytorum]TQL97059.1 NAD(P)H dehydrogenase (quinone) [Actinoallomurus bryophytorum]